MEIKENDTLFMTLATFGAVLASGFGSFITVDQ